MVPNWHPSFTNQAGNLAPGFIPKRPRLPARFSRWRSSPWSHTIHILDDGNPARGTAR